MSALIWRPARTPADSDQYAHRDLDAAPVAVVSPLSNGDIYIEISVGDSPLGSAAKVLPLAGDMEHAKRIAEAHVDGTQHLRDWVAPVAPAPQPIKSLAAYELARAQGLQIERAGRPGVALAWAEGWNAVVTGASVVAVQVTS